MKRRFYSGAMGMEAYDQGRTDIPLLDETIPHNLMRTIEAHEYREAIVSRHQRIRWNYFEFGERVRDLATSRATGSGSGHPTTPSGHWFSSRQPRSA
jgi:hypothetical protein